MVFLFGYMDYLIVLGIAGGMLWGNSDGKQIKSDSYHKEDSNEK